MHSMHPNLSNSNSIHLMCGWFVVWAFDRITNALIDKKNIKENFLFYTFITNSLYTKWYFMLDT